jgi:hypothetical protein
MHLNAVRDLGTNTPTAQDALDGQTTNNPHPENSNIVTPLLDAAALAALFQPLQSGIN